MRGLLFAWRLVHALVHFVVSIVALGAVRLEEVVRPRFSHADARRHFSRRRGL